MAGHKYGSPENRERNQTICELRKAGVFYYIIGERFGLCRERIRQIVGRANKYERRNIANGNL